MTSVGISVSFYAALYSNSLGIIGGRKAKFKVTFILGLSMLFSNILNITWDIPTYLTQKYK